jgi:hypothetical protein
MVAVCRMAYYGCSNVDIECGISAYFQLTSGRAVTPYKYSMHHARQALQVRADSLEIPFSSMP